MKAQLGGTYVKLRYTYRLLVSVKAGCKAEINVQNSFACTSGNA